MNRSDSIGKLAAALAKAQKSLKAAVKESLNPHFKSRYADLATIHDACRDALADNELALVQSPSADAGLVRMVTALLHSSGEWIESDPLQCQCRDAGPQAVGSAITYLRRYQLAAVLGIAPEDDDAEAPSGRPVEVPKAEPLKEQAQPAAPVAAKPMAKPAPVKAPNGKTATVDERGNPLDASSIPF